MRTSTLWTAAVLAYASVGSSPIQSTPPQLTSLPARWAPAVRPTAPTFYARVKARNVEPRDETKKKLPHPVESTAAQPFVVDYVNFIASQHRAFVEFYVQISYTRLSFIRAKSAKTFQAVYDLDFYIENADGEVIQTKSARDTVSVSTYDETRVANNYRVMLVHSWLRPGEYRWRAIITDQETRNAAEVAQQFSARDFSGQSLLVSDLQFSRYIHVDSSASLFVKHNRYIEPNVPHRYGEFANQLFIYYEIYNLAAPMRVTATTHDDSTVTTIAAVDSFRTCYLIRNENGAEIKQIWKSSRKPGNSCVQSVLLPIADLKSGQYTLTVRVFDDRNGTYAETSGRFTVAWSLFSFRDKTFEEILEQMRYLASREELRELAKLPEADRQHGLVEFWQRRDPTPATPENELMEEYYRRIAYANRYFKWKDGAGWKSPQGQIYIMYGPPDGISRWSNSPTQATNNDGWMQPGFPSDIRQETYLQLKARRYSQYEDAAYEAWEYVQLNRRFVFVDFRGMGNYELLDPLSLSDSWSR